jgi:ribosomal protein S18 acetylase RimI-like enzyme
MAGRAPADAELGGDFYACLYGYGPFSVHQWQREYMVIRKAELPDRDHVSRLHVMAGPNVYGYCFCCNEEKAVAINNVLFATDDTFCSGRYYHVCESDGIVQGAIGLYPARDNEPLGSNIGRHIGEIADITGYMAIARMALRYRFFRRFPALGGDELYIEALAVYPQFRGRGVSSALLDFAFQECARLKLPAVSLFAEINNEHALAVYRHRGFRVTDTVELPQRYRKHHLFGFHKLVAPVDLIS